MEELENPLYFSKDYVFLGKSIQVPETVKHYSEQQERLAVVLESKIKTK